MRRSWRGSNPRRPPPREQGMSALTTRPLFHIFFCSIASETKCFMCRTTSPEKCRRLTPQLDGFVRGQYNCLYRRKCDCVVAIAVRTYHDKVQILVSDEHTKDSHAEGSGILILDCQTARCCGHGCEMCRPCRGQPISC